MGDLDDAIREHLELKRRHGASEDEVTLKEMEAQRSGALPGDPGTARADLAPPARSEGPPAPAPEETPKPAPEETREPEPFEPDEVLPEEGLELDVQPRDAAAPAPAAESPLPDWSGPEPEEERVEPEDDVLEETPEFLEDMPEQDRLWFEQKPPKDFDFDD